MWCVLQARGDGPISFSLHMGHCIVMGEALLVVVVPQEASRVGTYSHFKKRLVWQGPDACRTCLMSHIGDAEAADKAEGSCYMPHMVSQDSQKQKTNLAPCCYSLFYGRTQENNPLRVLLNIQWRSSSLGDSIFLSQRVTKDLCLGEDFG